MRKFIKIAIKLKNAKMQKLQKVALKFFRFKFVLT